MMTLRLLWSETLRTFTVTAVFAVYGIGSVGLAEDTPKKAGEAWTAPGRAAHKENPVAADAKSLAAGKDLYTSACFPCHGTTGKGDGPAGAFLERDGAPVHPGNLSDPKMWQQSDGSIFWKISTGKTPMPAFDGAFTEEQRWQIVAYVRTRAPKEEKDSQQPKSK
jgi:mono/diheme cytochrome c family protein